ncbi:T9SS type B sorting domain-containing protein [Maribacter sp. 1_MG-2023]|uniref:T9SS type B sorting domain-containing protein n=1 Tax=Maribacter sp. 1_MG-2023 TaxID=3062677 RepID=UPI0026E37CDB|nr:T9SS type B sorting domain-containing protein [Maribacter sp. 1_MG-2023]MDO6470337.1 T9SS type B sorting domain-containing protein [Maribacter sp. 1_MG-2023]
MRTLLCSICCLFLFYWNVTAQNSADCRTAIPVCADQPIMGIAGGTGDVDDFDPDVILQTGCLEKGSLSSANIEFNTSWFVFRAGTGGQVGFDIEALATSGSTPTAEWDFAVYGPDVDCADISNGTAQPIRCNYEVNDTNFTGLGVNPESGEEGRASLTGSQNTYDEYLDVVPGEIYYILINNFADNFTGDPEPFMLTFTGSSVSDSQDTALDCALRDEFLGLDIIACEGDDPITISALNSPAGADIANVEWTVDYEDDGIVDDTLTGSGDFGAELVIISPNSGRYFATITTITGTPPTVADDSGVLVTFFGTPILDRVETLDTNLSIDPDQNNIEFFVEGDGDYEYAINDGAFQDDAVFMNVPPGINTVVINDKNGCGITDPIEFLVVGYPKFFTPNGDGINDDWNVEGIETLDNPVVFIFDRYGKLLKQLGANDSWDGNYNGQQMTSTDYWFRFEYGDMQDNLLVAKTRKTHFSLKR